MSSTARRYAPNAWHWVTIVLVMLMLSLELMRPLRADVTPPWWWWGAAASVALLLRSVSLMFIRVHTDVDGIRWGGLRRCEARWTEVARCTRHNAMSLTFHIQDGSRLELPAYAVAAEDTLIAEVEQRIGRSIERADWLGTEWLLVTGAFALSAVGFVVRAGDSAAGFPSWFGLGVVLGVLCAGYLGYLTSPSRQPRRPKGPIIALWSPTSLAMQALIVTPSWKAIPATPHAAVLAGVIVALLAGFALFLAFSRPRN